jgi:hypothetical protein
VRSGVFAEHSPSRASHTLGGLSDEPLVRCTEDIDAELLDALRAAWAAEGATPGPWGFRRRRSRAALARFLGNNPELVGELERRYGKVIPGEPLTDRACVGLWLVIHDVNLRALQPDS